MGCNIHLFQEIGIRKLQEERVKIGADNKIWHWLSLIPKSSYQEEHIIVCICPSSYQSQVEIAAPFGLAMTPFLWFQM